jgi:flagellar P-ring protein FlgI
MKRVCALLLLLGTIGYGQRIKDIATVAGLRYVHLKGIGIVAGLNGTGDSPKNLELQQKFQRILRYWGGGENNLATKNLALVLVTATVPSSTKPGQSFPVSVASIGDAKDLGGGELLECALRGPITPLNGGESDEVAYTDYAVAQGKISVPLNAKVKTAGATTAILERDFGIPFHSNFEHITLFLNQSDFNTASSVAAAINRFSLFRDTKVPLAQAVDAASIQVRIPANYLKGERVVDFASIVLGIPLEQGDVDRQARVVINKRTGTVVVNGEVKVRSFSAVIDGLVVRIPPAGVPGDDPAAAHPRLIDILAELRKQNLATTDIVTVLRGMEQAGVLEGAVVEE